MTEKSEKTYADGLRRAIELAQQHDDFLRATREKLEEAGKLQDAVTYSWMLFQSQWICDGIRHEIMAISNEKELPSDSGGGELIEGCSNLAFEEGVHAAAAELLLMNTNSHYSCPFDEYAKLRVDIILRKLLGESFPDGDSWKQWISTPTE